MWLREHFLARVGTRSPARHAQQSAAGWSGDSVTNSVTGRGQGGQGQGAEIAALGAGLIGRCARRRASPRTLGRRPDLRARSSARDQGLQPGLQGKGDFKDKDDGRALCNPWGAAEASSGQAKRRARAKERESPRTARAFIALPWESGTANSIAPLKPLHELKSG